MIRQLSQRNATQHNPARIRDAERAASSEQCGRALAHPRTSTQPTAQAAGEGGGEASRQQGRTLIIYVACSMTVWRKGAQSHQAVEGGGRKVARQRSEARRQHGAKLGQLHKHTRFCTEYRTKLKVGVNRATSNARRGGEGLGHFRRSTLPWLRPCLGRELGREWVGGVNLWSCYPCRVRRHSAGPHCIRRTGDSTRQGCC